MPRGSNEIKTMEFDNSGVCKNALSDNIEQKDFGAELNAAFDVEEKGVKNAVKHVGREVAEAIGSIAEPSSRLANESYDVIKSRGKKRLLGAAGILGSSYAGAKLANSSKEQNKGIKTQTLDDSLVVKGLQETISQRLRRGAAQTIEKHKLGEIFNLNKIGQKDGLHLVNRRPRGRRPDSYDKPLVKGLDDSLVVKGAMTPTAQMSIIRDMGKYVPSTENGKIVYSYIPAKPKKTKQKKDEAQVGIATKGEVWGVASKLRKAVNSFRRGAEHEAKHEARGAFNPRNYSENTEEKAVTMADNPGEFLNQCFETK